MIIPKGTTKKVLVSQVYVRVQPGDLDDSGALLAGRDVQLNLSADATNSGTIAGRNLVQINAKNIQNMGGNVSGAAVALLAEQDINNIGGQIQAQSAALLSAGRDINITTTTQSSANRAGNNSFAQTGIDRVAGLYVSGPAGVLIASAGRDLNLTAAQISNQGSGLGSATTLSAAQNINLGTVTTSSSQDIRWSGVNYLRQSNSQDVGSQINTTGNLTLNAGQDLSAKAATINAGQALNVTAQRDLNITTGQTSQSLDTANRVTSKGMMSSRTLSTRQTSQSTTAVASNLEGQSVSISAGQDQQTASNYSQTTREASGIAKAVGKLINTLDPIGTRIPGTAQSLVAGALLTRSQQTGKTVQTTSTVRSSSLSGDTVDISSGRDTTLKAAQVVADGAVSIQAGGQIQLQAAEQIQQSNANNSSDKSGLLSAKALSFSIGTSQQTQTEQQPKNHGCGTEHPDHESRGKCQHQPKQAAQQLPKRERTKWH